MVTDVVVVIMVVNNLDVVQLVCGHLVEEYKGVEVEGNDKWDHQGRPRNGRS